MYLQIDQTLILLKFPCLCVLNLYSEVKKNVFLFIAFNINYSKSILI